MDPFRSRRESRALGDSGAYGGLRPGAPGRRPGDSSIARTPSPTGKRERSPIERAIVWGGIAILAVILLVESGARLSYNRAYRHIDERFSHASRATPFLLADAMTLIRRKPVEGGVARPGGKLETYTWKWFSLFKPNDYQLRIYVTDQDDKKIVAEWKTYEQFKPEDEAAKAAAAQGLPKIDEPPPKVIQPEPKAALPTIPDTKKPADPKTTQPPKP